MPLVAWIVILVIRPLQKRQAVQREAQSEVTTITTDTVAGLRILRGIGGEDVFARRYREASQELRRRGVEVAGTQSVLMSLQVLLPGLFVAVVVWAAARLAIDEPGPGTGEGRDRRAAPGSWSATAFRNPGRRDLRCGS